jgi:HEAT repeat protein
LGNRENLDLNLLYQRLLTPPWYAKTACLKILGLRRAASSVEHIKNLMNDSNIEVRRTLAVVLGEIGDDKALALLAKLTNDSSPFVKKPAQQALQKASQLKFS